MSTESGSVLTLKGVLLHHLEYTFVKEAWQPSLAMAVEGLTAAQAAWAPALERHSIWQIVRHVIQCNHAVLEAWDGTRPVYRVGHGPTEYAVELERTDWPKVSGNEATWRADVQALHAVAAEIQRRVENLAEPDLLRPFPGEDMPLGLRLLRMATHDAYHATSRLGGRDVGCEIVGDRKFSL